MSRKKKALTLSGKIIAGIAAGSLTAGAIYMLGIVSLPTITRAAVSSEVDTSASSSSEMACIGSAVQIGSDPTNPLGITNVGEAKISATSPAGTTLDSFLLSRTGIDEQASASQPKGTTLDSDERRTSALAQSQMVSSDTMKGLTASACNQPLAESWLVAGSTVTGSSSLVLLTNPGNVTSTVTLTVYSENGVVDTPGSTNLVVEARSQRVVSLNGLAPGVNASVVHVQSRGGKIAASLQESITEGLDAIGIDTSTAVAGPSKQVSIPGVRVGAPIAGEATDDHEHDLSRVLRVFSSGESTSQVKVIAHGPDGSSEELGTFDVVPLTVNEFVIPELPEGVYTVTLESDALLLGSVRLVTAGTVSPDFAAFQAADAFTGKTAFATVSGPNPRLSIYNAGPSPANVIVIQGETKQTITVPSQTAAPVQLTEGVGYTLDSTMPLFAGVSLIGDNAIAGYPVQSPSVDADPVTVYTR